MRPEQLNVALRPRLPWEAGDLGCALVRRDFGSILAFWSVSVLPLWLVLGFLLRDHPSWFPLVVWWLKPLYDRVPLHVISRSAFGSPTRLSDGLRSLPGLWTKFLLPALLWRRLSPARSFILPIWLLEGQRGAKLRQRASGLASEGGGSGVSLTWVFIKLEIAVFAGLLILTSFAAPDSGYENTADLITAMESGEFDFSAAQYWWSNLCYLVALTIVEPFYVGAGFGLYLNSRAKLEGWDVELTFRQTAARLLQSAAPMMALMLGLLLLGGGNLRAQADAKPPANGDELARQVLEAPEFEVHSRTQRIWVPNEDKPERAVADWVGLLFMVLGYAALAAVLAALGVMLWRAARRLRKPTLIKGARARPPPPKVVMGLPIEAASLPEDLLGEARQAWARGDFREALSLLYRGALSALVTQRELPIRASDTEDDCLQRVREGGPATLARYFAQLTRVWMRAAYAGRPPVRSEFDALCRDWPFAGLSRSISPLGKRLVALPLLVAGCLLHAGCNGRWEEVTEETGYRGKARLDPFLAAQEFLKARGFTTRRAPGLRELPWAENGLVIASAENGMPVGRARPLLDWVRQGGHLVYAMAGGGPYNDWTTPALLAEHTWQSDEERPDPILDALGVTMHNHRAEAMRKAVEEVKGKKDKANMAALFRENLVESALKIGNRTLQIELPGYLDFTLDRELKRGEHEGRAEEKTQLLSLRYGIGRVTILTHARPLRNRYFNTTDHGQFLDWLAGKEPGEALFVVGIEGSFWQLLWERAWRVLAALGALLTVWLWAVLPRFGPVRPAILHPVRRFADHLESLGHFYFKTRRQEHLLASAQAALQRRLRETHPHLTEPGACQRFLVERSSLPRERVAAALANSGGQSASHFVRLLQDLQTLRHSLS